MMASFSKWLIPLLNVYFCNDSRLDCTFLVMADDVALEIPARCGRSTTTTGRSGPVVATADC